MPFCFTESEKNTGKHEPAPLWVSAALKACLADTRADSPMLRSSGPGISAQKESEWFAKEKIYISNVNKI
jgi:hypothetical protein